MRTNIIPTNPSDFPMVLTAAQFFLLKIESMEEIIHVEA